jgi:branched-chain amino acid transport system permease protein
MYKKTLPIFILAVIVFLFFLPQLAGKYVMYMMMHILLLSVFALGFNLLLGYTGLLSFGQAGFYACGAYGCAKVLLVMPSLRVSSAGSYSLG